MKLSSTDLNLILDHTRELWEDLRGERLFITGGTGFFGCWLLESFAYANKRLQLGASATVLTRNLDSFYQKAPHLVSHPSIQFHTGDICTFKFPDMSFSYVIHAATESSTKLQDENSLHIFDTIIQGTKHILNFIRHCGARKILLTSSGAIYGNQPPDLSHIPEEYPGAPDPTNPNSAYGEGKRAAETMCTLYGRQYGFETKIARCFAFVGPYLPLDTHFAIGNFIRDSMLGGPILVNGDGTPYRSYLYAADLTIWLWTILFKGIPFRPYNVGSEDAITIKELANLIAETLSTKTSIEVRIAKKPETNTQAQRYVPSTQRAQTELKLKKAVSLKDSIYRTYIWNTGYQRSRRPLNG